jgi:hypothetical protein
MIDGVVSVENAGLPACWGPAKVLIDTLQSGLTRLTV